MSEKKRGNGFLAALVAILVVIIAILVAGLIIAQKKASQNGNGEVVINVTPGGNPGNMTERPYNPESTPVPGETFIPDVTPVPTEVPTPTPAPTPMPTFHIVEYSGRVEHLFTHSLVAFPELAYKQSDKTSLVNSTYFVDCITVKEFKAVLEALYADNYMLININDIYEVASNGKVTLKKSFPFPEGKKPLVFSFDDTNYYANKMGNGMVDKLILKDGKIVTYTKHATGEEVISDDNEFIPIIDKFVEQHPDFSYNGAKGMICLTGFDGILGYRTQRVSEGDGRTEADRQAEIEAVKPIVQALKDTGWYFGCHSYKHGTMERQSASTLEDDAKKFKNEVTPLIGETKIYIYPYGSWSRSSDGKTVPKNQAVLNKYGFQYFCSVGANWYTKTRSDLGNVILQDRANVDGTSILRYQDYFSTDKDYGTPRFPSIVWRDIYDDARNISYDEAIRVYKESRGLS